EDPAVHDDYILHVAADANGNISWNQWAPDWHDLNVRFYLLAKQVTLQGERRAQTTFTDALNTNTTVASSLNPSAFGQSVTFTATVTCTGCTFDSGHRI